MTQLDSRNRTTMTRVALATFGAGLLLSLAAPQSDARTATPHKTAAPTKAKSVSKITYQRSSSEETRAERDRRLYRECKGLPTAGACLGYARGR